MARFKVGDIVQYNKYYNPKKVVLILEIMEDYALIKFPSGTKLVTTLSGLWPLKNNTEASEKVQAEKRRSQQQRFEFLLS